ncbi:MAG: spondin domain-containing protein [Gammaproteobacteria bacterium]|nr:spondin domain-containing protein [Gammaproteobacteria bacterium]
MKKLLSIISLTLLFNFGVDASGLKTYQVTITNATAKHVFTPTFIVTHSSKFSLFKVGEAASDGLAFQAENGNPANILAETQGLPGVYDTVVGTGIHGGETSSFTITAPKRARLSLTAMLATTNDSFVALNSVRLPKKSVTYYANIYDAGSELNNELCAFIPGPHCPENSGNARHEAGSEGFITIANGIQGDADLSAQDLDWNNPGATITITRIHDNDDD